MHGWELDDIVKARGITLEPGVEDNLRTSAHELIKQTGMVEVDLTIDLPNLAAHWMMGNLSTLLDELGDRWPSCARDLTEELLVGLLPHREEV